MHVIPLQSQSHNAIQRSVVQFQCEPVHTTVQRSNLTTPHHNTTQTPAPPLLYQNVTAYSGEVEAFHGAHKKRVCGSTEGELKNVVEKIIIENRPMMTSGIPPVALLKIPFQRQARIWCPVSSGGGGRAVLRGGAGGEGLGPKSLPKMA